nr:putative integron gene cassette protein [uncultured bacterium]CAP47580.1 putative integron gene cassette protein [uncultured bacterium]
MLGGPLGWFEFDTQHHHKPTVTPLDFTTTMIALLLRAGLGAVADSNSFYILQQPVLPSFVQFNKGTEPPFLTNQPDLRYTVVNGVSGCFCRYKP